MAYTIDVYRDRLKPSTDFTAFALYVSFFPQLVAGPIERAGRLLPQLMKIRRFSFTTLQSGMPLILFGFFKKIVIADSLAPIVESCFQNPTVVSGPDLLFGIYAFAIQIYCDFSGYSDIARGIARMLGIELMNNFTAPYFSRNITEFWRRWHISLSSWLKDYLYISLGGNRISKTRTYVNLMLTMLLGGLWHGAAWTFVIWGALHGLYLSIHKLLLNKRKPGNSDRREKLFGLSRDILKIIITFNLVCFTWIFFRAPSFKIALDYTMGIFTNGGVLNLFEPVFFAIIVSIVIDVGHRLSENYIWLNSLPSLLRYIIMIVLIAAGILSFGWHFSTPTPFIYFQF